MPNEIKSPPAAPQVIPDNITFGQLAEVATLDGANLDQCGDKHAALVSVIDVVQEIQGSKP